MSQEQTSRRAIGLGRGRLSVWDEKARHNGDSASTTGEVHRGCRELACPQTSGGGLSAFVELAGTQTTTRGIAVNESLECGERRSVLDGLV